MHDLIDYSNLFIYYMITVSTGKFLFKYLYFLGYFIFDLYDMFIHGQILNLWELTLHHLVVSY